MIKLFSKAFSVVVSLLILLSTIPIMHANAAADCNLYASFVDSSGSPIQGIEFELFDSANNSVTTATTTNVSNASVGNLRITGLNSGIYSLRIKSPDYFITDANVKNEYETDNGFLFALTAGDNTFIKGSSSVTLTQIQGKVVLTKSVNGTGAIPSGVTFELYKKEETAYNYVSRHTTNASGKIELDLFYGDYQFKEVSAPAPIVVDNTPVQFSIAQHNTTVNVSKTNDFKCSVTLTKASTDSSLLPGVTFALHKQSGDFIGNYTTSATGTITVSNLSAGDYYFKEVAAPDNHELDTSRHSFTLSYANYNVDLSATNKKFPTITIAKRNEAGNLLAGAALQILQGNTVVQEFTTNASNSNSFLLAPGNYTLKEKTAPTGYYLANDIDFVVSSGTNQTITMTNKQNTFEFKKYCETNNGDAMLGGVKMQLFSKTTNSIYKEWTTVDDEALTLKGLPYGDYVIKEITPLPGYKTANDIEFSVNENTKEIKKEMRNKKIITSIFISKVRKDTDTHLAGASMKISGSKLAQDIAWTTDGTEKEISLETGTYTLTETAAPNGYVLDATPVTITISQDGQEITFAKGSQTTTFNNGQPAKYKMENAPITVKIKKAEKESKKEVAGAKLNISNTTGFSQDITTQVGGNVLEGLAPGEYTIKEVSAPAGFKLGSDKKITVTNTADVQEFIYENELLKGDIKLTKTGDLLNDYSEILDNFGFTSILFDWITGNLSNVEFALYAKEDIISPVDGSILYKKDALINTVNTNLLGVAEFNNLPLGDYVIKETTPNGYIAGTDIDVTLAEVNGAVVAFNKDVENNLTNIHVKVNKTDVDGNPVRDAFYGLYNKDTINVNATKQIPKDSLISTCVTNDAGVAEFNLELLPLGEYYVKEIKAPAGHILSQNVFDINFTLSNPNFSLGDALVTFEFNDVNDYTKVTISKVDKSNKQNVPDATLQLLQNGNVVQEWITTDKDKIFNKLVPGEYVIRELKAPAGYAKAADQTIDVKLTADEQKFTVENEKISGNITINKKDTDNTSLKGVVFTVKNDITGETTDYTTDDRGNIMVPVEIGRFENNQLKENATYTITEKSTLDGYIPDTQAHAVTFDFLNNPNETNEKVLNLVNDYTKVTISKVDRDNKQNVPDATLQLLQNGNVIQEWITTDKDKTFNKLVPGEYVIRELKAPAGYAKAADQTIDVKLTADEQKFTVENEKILGNITINKKDTDNTSLKGVVFTVKNDITRETTDYTTDDRGNIMVPVEIGRFENNQLKENATYTITEKSTLDGYIPDTQAHAVTFDFLNNPNETNEKVLNLVNDYTKISIKKTDENKNGLAGASLCLKDSSGNKLHEWTTDGSAYVITKLIPGTYYISETVAPEGYEKQEKDTEIKVEETLELQTFELINKKAVVITPDEPDDNEDDGGYDDGYEDEDEDDDDGEDDGEEEYDDTPEPEEKSPKTGDLAFPLCSLVLLFVSAIALLFVRKKK